ARSLRRTAAIGNPARENIFANFARSKAEHQGGGRFRRSVQLNAAQSEKHDDGGKGGALVAVDERMVLRDTESVGCRQHGEVVLAVNEFVDRTRQRRLKQSEIANAVGSAKESQLLRMHIQNDIEVEPFRLAHLASAL